MSEPFITIVVPAKNSETTLEKCINSLLNLDYTNYEIIVIDDGSNDKTQEILGTYKDKITVITNSSSLGPSESRNIAAQEAKGEYLAFTDSDCIVDKLWLKELLAGFSDSHIASVGGRQEIPQDESKFGRRVSKFMKKVGFVTDYMHKAGEKIELVDHNPSCNVMYKRDVFIKEGGFLKGLWPGEDVELDYRLKKKGYAVLFNPKAAVYHYRNKALSAFLRMMYRYGLAQGILVRKYGIFRKIQFLPFICLSAIPIFILGFPYSIIKVLLAMAVLSLLFYFNLNAYLILLTILGLLCWNIGFYKGILTMESIKPRRL